MTNLTDPTLAPLVARYRAWVEEMNKQGWKEWEKQCVEARRQYDEALQECREYQKYGLFKRLPRHYSPGLFFPSKPTYQGFLDWCIREGIEAPKGGV